MNPTQSPEDELLQATYNPLKVMQPGERVVCEIKRHPVGIIGTYLTFILLVIVAVVAVVVAPHFVSSMTSRTQAIVALGAFIVCAFTGLFTYINASVYKGNRWIVTTDSITQITQVSLFNKQTSQLSLANLENVAVEQRGMLQAMFNYGRLRAETAGERTKFVFDYCPDPNSAAKKIIAAHEAYIAEKPAEMHTTNQALANTAAFNQSYGQPQELQSYQQPVYPQQAEPEPGNDTQTPQPQ